MFTVDVKQQHNNNNNSLLSQSLLLITDILLKTSFIHSSAYCPEKKRSADGRVRLYKIINTVELQRLEHLWDHENYFETGCSSQCGLIIAPGWRNMNTCSIFFIMKVCCVFSLESPHRGDSNEYTQHDIINTKKKTTLNYPKYNNVCTYGIFSLGLQERVGNNRGKRDIGVRATEVLL